MSLWILVLPEEIWNHFIFKDNLLHQAPIKRYSQKQPLCVHVHYTTQTATFTFTEEKTNLFPFLRSFLGEIIIYFCPRIEFSLTNFGKFLVEQKSAFSIEDLNLFRTRSWQESWLCNSKSTWSFPHHHWSRCHPDMCSISN